MSSGRTRIELSVMGNPLFLLTVLSIGQFCWAQVQLPPGFEVVNITDDPAEDRYPRMNNCGEVVFRKALPGDLTGVFLYDNGKTTQVSVDGDYNTFPDINDDGVVVWSRWDYEMPIQIVIYEDGVITQLTHDPAGDRSPRINNLGHVVWNRGFGDGCGGVQTDIMFWDGTTIEQLTDDAYSKQSAWINDLDDIVWTQYDFCVSPWESQIMLHTAEGTSPLWDDQPWPQHPTINNLGQVAWGTDGPDIEDSIKLWEDGVATVITDWGHGPCINNHAEILFWRWHDDQQTGNVWWYRDGEFYQLTDDPFADTGYDINDDGEAVWWIGQFEHRDVGMMRRIRNADVDLDFDVDPNDFAGFPECMTGPVDSDHLCECRFFDIDHDRDIDLTDFGAFQNLFTGEDS